MIEILKRHALTHVGHQRAGYLEAQGELQTRLIGLEV